MQGGLAESTPGPNSGGEQSSNRSAAQLVIEAADSFNYAAWQNAVPLLRSVIIDNTNGTELSSLTVELTASPAFVRGKGWTVDCVGVGEKLTLKEVDLDVDPAYLDSERFISLLTKDYPSWLEGSGGTERNTANSGGV